MKQEIKERVEKIQRGEVPEGYRKTKVGIIPDGWHFKKFGGLADFKNGLNFTNNDGKEIIKIIGVTGFQKNFMPQYNSFELVKIDRKLNDEELLKKEDLLFVRSNGNRKLIGRCLYINKIKSSTSFSGFTIRARINSNEIESLYCAHLFHFYPIKKQIFILGGGTNISNLSQEILSEIKIQYPIKITERNNIINILSTWDKAIELKEKLIEEKKEFKRGLMQKLLTGKIRFPEFTDEWDEKKIGVICEIKKGVQINKTELSFKGKYAVLNGGVSPSGYTTEWNTKENTITISEGGNSCGFVNFNKDKIWCGGHCYALTNVKMNNLLLYHILKSVEKKIMKLRVGSGLPNIQKQDVINFRLLIPKNVTEQEKIAQILDLISIEIVILIKELNQLKEQKRGLMQLLLTGIVRVEVD